MSNGELAARLRELREDAAPPSLAGRLEGAIPDSFVSHEAGWRVPRAVRWAAVGAVVIAAAAILPRFQARRTALVDVLDPVAYATGNTDAVHLVLMSRTRQGEDWSFVQLDGGMQRVEAWLENPQQRGGGRVRMEKPDRSVVFDGRETTRYFRRRNEALRLQGWGVELEPVWPAAWLRQIARQPSGEFEVLAHDEAASRVRLLLFEKGVSPAPLPPSFLGEFDRETELVWDQGTQRLLSLRRWVRHGGARVLVSETELIEYLPLVDGSRFRLALPTDVRWIGLAGASPEVAAMGPREVTRALFAAAAQGDRALLAMLCSSPATADFLLENPPAEVLTLGEPFHTASYPGAFVPYRVRLRGGRVFSHQLAVRNDNAQRRWEYDGGLW